MIVREVYDYATNTLVSFEERLLTTRALRECHGKWQLSYQLKGRASDASSTSRPGQCVIRTPCCVRLCTRAVRRTRVRVVDAQRGLTRETLGLTRRQALR